MKEKLKFKHLDIQLELEIGVAQVWLNRTDKRNALNLELIAELLKAFDALNMYSQIKVIILLGKGKVFCAGADINMFLENKETDAGVLSELFNAIYSFPKPIIAAVHGHIFGGGVGLLSACDIVIANEGTVFQLPEVRLGIVPSTIMPYLLNRMPASKLKKYVLTASAFSANTALQLNLVDEVCTANLLEQAMERAKEMTKASPDALQESKRLIAQLNEEENHQKKVEYAKQSLIAIKKTENAQEGLRSFLEKRKPNWK